MTGSRTWCLLVIVARLLVTGTSAAVQVTPESIRGRTEREWAIKAEKMRWHLLPLTRRHDVDLWIILSRENAPDPLVSGDTALEYLSGRRPSSESSGDSPSPRVVEGRRGAVS